MGINLIGKSCWLQPSASAPNPDPSRWELIDKVEFNGVYVLKVKYLDATNFDGIKIMVYCGEYKPRIRLDPHFEDNDQSPIARFRPDTAGWVLAIELAKSLSENC